MLTSPNEPVTTPKDASNIDFRLVGYSRGWGSYCCCDTRNNPLRFVAESADELREVTANFESYGWGTVELDVDAICFESYVAVVIYSSYSSGAFRSYIESVTVEGDSLVVRQVSTSASWCPVTADIGFWQTVILIDRTEFQEVDEVVVSRGSITFCELKEVTRGEHTWKVCDSTCWGRENDFFAKWIERVTDPFCKLEIPPVMPREEHNLEFGVTRLNVGSIERLSGVSLARNHAELAAIFADMDADMPDDVFFIGGDSIIVWQTGSISGGADISVDSVVLIDSEIYVYATVNTHPLAPTWMAWDVFLICVSADDVGGIPDDVSLAVVRNSV
jgi:hypothetical protein